MEENWLYTSAVDSEVWRVWISQWSGLAQLRFSVTTQALLQSETGEPRMQLQKTLQGI